MVLSCYLWRQFSLFLGKCCIILLTNWFTIQEAQQLWERIKEKQGVNKWRPDLEEEYEDREGNIYNKKTYTDLQRQGLI